MRIVYLTANMDAAGCYRCLFPARELRRRGHEAALAPFTAEKRADGHLLVRFQKPVRTRTGFVVVGVDRIVSDLKPDVLVCQMQLDRVIAELIPAWKSQGIRVVAECDDTHLDIPSWNPAREGTDPRRYPDRNRDWLHQSFRLADALTVSTPYLAEVYRDFNDVTVIPNRLEWSMWENVIPAYKVQRRRLRVGWMGDSKWRTGDLKVLRGVIGPWLQRNPQVEFVAAGDPKIHDLLGVPESQRVSTCKVEFRQMDLADITAVMDVGLVPLADIEFNEAKSNLKGMEYAACGIPCIATPTQQYKAWVDPGVNGLLARKPADWFKALDLLRDDTLRHQMGQAARQKARAEALDRHVNEWENLYTGLCGHPNPAREKAAA